MGLKIDSEWARYSTLGLQFGLTILFTLWLGTKLDQWLDLSPWGVLGMGMLGFGAALYHLVRGAANYERKKG